MPENSASTSPEHAPPRDTPRTGSRADAGLSRFTYWKLERGESNPDTPANPRLRSILAVAQALDVELADLLPKHIPDLRRS